MADESTPTRCLPAAEVADLLGVSVDAVYDLISSQALPAVRIGRPGSRKPRLSVPLHAYEAFVAGGGVAA